MQGSSFAPAICEVVSEYCQYSTYRLWSWSQSWISSSFSQWVDDLLVCAAKSYLRSMDPHYVDEDFAMFCKDINAVSGLYST